MGIGFKEKINIINPEYIGFSFTTVHEYRQSIPYIYEARETKSTLLAGGVYLRAGGAVIDGLFDFVCRGEGEAIPNFLLAGDSTIFDVPQREENIDLLPDYCCVTGFEFDRGIPFFANKKIIPYSSSRGCPYKCHFCLAKGQIGQVRIKTTIKDDLHGLYERFTPDLFYIMDELPPYYDKRWRSQIDGNKYPFCCYIRCDIKEEHLMFLINNGMKYCVFGVETGDEEHRINLLGKTITDTQILNTVKILRDNNIQYVAFYMTGTPGETNITRAKTVYMREKVGGFSIAWQYEELFPFPKEPIVCTEEDIPRLNFIFGHESIWPFIKDGSTPESLRYIVGEHYVKSPGVVVLSPTPDSAVMFKTHNGTTLNIHPAVLPKNRKCAVDIIHESVAWIFKNTQYIKIIAFIGTCFPNVCKFAEKCGFSNEGTIKSGVFRDGTLYDQIIYGLTKEDFDG